MSATTGACACEHENAVEWIRVGFGDCVYTSTDFTGFSFGMLSIACWLVAQLPQFVQNFRSGSAEGLSPWFLAEWLLGDTFNLLGCLMTGDQLPSEVYTAAYFMCVDVVMIFQFVYYALRSREALEIITSDLRDPGDRAFSRDRGLERGDEIARRLLGDEDDANSDSDSDSDSADDSGEPSRTRTATYLPGGTVGGALRTVAIVGTTTLGIVMGIAVASTRGTGSITGDYGGERLGLSESGRPDVDALQSFSRFAEASSENHASRRDGLEDADGAPDSPVICGSTSNPAWEVTFGRAVGYVSAMFYLCSRISQIVKNHKRKSCEGLSAAMFSTAAAANVLYGSAIVLRANTAQSLVQSVPWLLGSLGTVALDSTILAQSVVYGDESARDEPGDVESEDEGRNSSSEDRLAEEFL
jgi:uncharacterized protein with PQ loop repeat